MVTEIKTTEPKDVKIIHESVFWDEDDPRWKLSGKKTGNPKVYLNLYQSVDLSKDSYIWAFTGTRGAGKTIAMTYYAGMAVYIWDMRLVSNYPISFVLKKGDTSKYVESEPLDLYKLLCFDEDYKKCLILIDEAPDIISHLASMTWKNRLLNIFVRQLRKNMNSLFFGSQQLGLIDKSMRWQTDIVVRCKDAFRLYGSSGGLDRGACILLDFYDHSGQWTGESINADWDNQLDMVQPTDSLELPGAIVWDAFNTYYQQDIFESLRRVDMKLESYEVGNSDKFDFSNCIESALPVITNAMNTGKKVETVELYQKIGDLTDKEKKYLGKTMRLAGVKTTRDARFKDFTNFDIDKFVEFANK